jgi:hypothetical protein
VTAAISGSEWWRVNGVDLHTWATRIESAEGLYVAPGIRDTDQRIPGRRGVVPGPFILDATEFVLNMWAKGVDPATGDIPDGTSSLALFDAARGELARLFYSPTLTIEHGRADGTVRVATGRLSQGIGFGRQTSHPLLGRMAVAIRIHGGLWHDPDPIGAHYQVPPGGTAELWEFDGTEAPMDDLELTVGPTWNLTLTDTGSGGWLAYDGIVQFGESLRIDCAARRVFGDGGLVVDQGLIRRSGPSFFSVAPWRPPSITVTHGSSDDLSLQVWGRRSYFTA